ncbi:MAG: superoxide dismutase [bacterium]|nr:superoxide dismutase [bacterium]
MTHTLPKLAYSYDALEPYIDKLTMEIHHTKHHQAYIDKLNVVLKKHPDLAEKPLEALLKDLNTLSINEADKKTIQNHGGGHSNHSLFWKIMGPDKQIDESLVHEINQAFGSTEDFKKQFSDVASKVFGSGWAWLVRNQDNKLQIKGMPNQDSPYINNETPIMGLDVWEHAYYLKYQNRRPEYIENWWNVLKLI